MDIKKLIDEKIPADETVIFGMESNFYSKIELRNPKNERFYVILIKKDIFSDVFVVFYNGGSKKAACEQRPIPVSCRKDIVVILQNCLKTRKAHGYQIAE